MSSVSPATPGPQPESALPGIRAPHADYQSRLYSLDILRGIALIGILFVSIWEFGGFTDNKQLFYRTGTHGGNYQLLSAVTILLEGKMRALFAIVFGAGIILFITKRNPEDSLTPDHYIRRNLWLMGFGLIDAFILLWPGDILFQYAAVGILLFPFWRMNKKALVIASLITTLIYCGKIYWNYADDQKAFRKFKKVELVEKGFVTADSNAKKTVDSLVRLQHRDPFSDRWANETLLVRHKNDTLTKDQANDKQSWEGITKRLKYDSAADGAENKAMRSGSYVKIRKHLVNRAQFKESYGFYQVGVWDVSSMVFLGMALLGFGIFHYKLTSGKYWLIGLLCLAAGLALGWWRNHSEDLKLADYAAYIDKHSIPYDQFFPIERALLAVGYICIVLQLIRSKLIARICRPVAALGQMAFSNYLLQTILCTAFFYGYGMGYFGWLSQATLYFIAAEIILLEMLFSVIWLRYFTMGPVEWLWSVLTTRTSQPFKRAKTPTMDLKIN